MKCKQCGYEHPAGMTCAAAERVRKGGRMPGKAPVREKMPLPKRGARRGK